MFRTIQDFLIVWKQENEETIKVFKNLTDASLNQKVTSDGRSLGFLAWHIILSLGEMGEKAGLKITVPPEGASVPASSSEIVTAYEKAGSDVASEVQAKWTDETLEHKIEMYGEKWRRGATLYAICVHQIHHRAQMTVLMRQAGLKVPGIYGPSKEEWSQIGMPAPQ